MKGGSVKPRVHRGVSRESSETGNGERSVITGVTPPVALAAIGIRELTSPRFIG